MLFVRARFQGKGIFLFLAGYMNVIVPAIAARQGSTMQADVCSLFHPLDAGAAHDLLCTGTPLNHSIIAS